MGYRDSIDCGYNLDHHLQYSGLELCAKFIKYVMASVCAYFDCGGYSPTFVPRLYVKGFATCIHHDKFRDMSGDISRNASYPVYIVDFHGVRRSLRL